MDSEDILSLPEASSADYFECIFTKRSSCHSRKFIFFIYLLLYKEIPYLLSSLRSAFLLWDFYLNSIVCDHVFIFSFFLFLKHSVFLSHLYFKNSIYDYCIMNIHSFHY